jgi:hypothetical protein
MKSSRLASIAWILGAIAAGFLGAFLWGLSEHPEGVAGGQLLVGGALLAAGTGILGLLRPTTMLARWSVVLAVACVPPRSCSRVTASSSAGCRPFSRPLPASFQRPGRFGDNRTEVAPVAIVTPPPLLAVAVDPGSGRPAPAAGRTNRT